MDVLTSDRTGTVRIDILLGFLRLITSESVRIVPGREGQLCGAGEVSGQLNKLKQARPKNSNSDEDH